MTAFEGPWSIWGDESDGLPIRVLYFDGTHVDRRYELEIFMELVREYSSRKRTRRILPGDFGEAAAAGA